MRAREHMRSVLNDTGLYNLTEGVPGDWEISALGAGFALIEEELEMLDKDLFVSTAGKEQLGAWEKMIRPQISTADTETRRKMLAERFLQPTATPTLESIEKELIACGVTGKVIYDGNSLSLMIREVLGITNGEAIRELELLMPAHIPWEIDKGTNWISLKRQDYTFAMWNACGLTWKELDQWVVPEFTDQ